MRSDLTKAFYTNLFKQYIIDQKWDYKNTKSGIYQKNGMLLDDFYADSVPIKLHVNKKFALGFRIIPYAKELKRYENRIPGKYLESAIEANRIVVSKNFQGLGLTQLIGKLCFDYCRKNGFRYVIFCGNQEKMNGRLKRFPGIKVFEQAIEYPEGPATVSICDTSNPGLRFIYSHSIFSVFLGRQLVKKLSNSIHIGH